MAAWSIILYTRNILETGTVTVTGTADAGYPEERLHDRSGNFYWKDTATGAYTFTVDQGAVTTYEVDFLAIPRHNFNGEDMQFQWSTDNFAADTNDAVTDWTQGDNLQIIKTLGAALDKRYWRVTVTSMDNPQCSEIFMSYGYEFEILADPGSRREYQANVRWNKTFGDTERATKFGPSRRLPNYTVLLSAADLVSWQSAMDDLDDYSKPFFIKDHAGNYFMARFSEPPGEGYNHKTHTEITIDLIEMLDSSLA